MKRRAFTLIELLVVIAIIAILAAILFPVFAKAREKARQTACASNEKQIGTAIMQYTQDYDEMYPMRWFNNVNYSWRQAVQPYIKNAQVFACPSNTDNSVIADPAIPALNMPAITRSYASNDRIIGDAPHALAYVDKPAQKVMVSELRWQNWQDYGSSWWNGWGWDQASCMHSGMINYLEADGHVKAMRPSATAAPFNMWGGMDGGQNGNTRDVNIDGVEQMIVDGMRALEQNQCR